METVADQVPEPWGARLEIMLRELGGIIWLQIAAAIVLHRLIVWVPFHLCGWAEIARSASDTRASAAQQSWNIPPPPLLIMQRRYDMDDFTPQEPGTAAKVIDGIQSASQHVSEAIEASRRPGMPLYILARAVREAPLAALAIAFLVGTTVSRRRR